MDLKVGEVYNVDHKRKGKFVAKITALGEEWVGVEVVNGSAYFMSASNRLAGRGEKGDEITVRKSFCTFRPFRAVAVVMKNILLRNIPDEIDRKLRIRAAMDGISKQKLILKLITEAINQWYENLSRKI